MCLKMRDPNKVTGTLRLSTEVSPTLPHGWDFRRNTVKTSFDGVCAACLDVVPLKIP